MPAVLLRIVHSRFSRRRIGQKKIEAQEFFLFFGENQEPGAASRTFVSSSLSHLNYSLVASLCCQCMVNLPEPSAEYLCTGAG